ncbi:MAG: ATP-binding cassette domain-containing protein, partial [Candidatus Aminicenantales bacterium]
TDNLTLSYLRPYSSHGLISSRKQRQAASSWVEKLSIRTQSPEEKVWTLSGGNQQKVALARLLHQEASVFLMDEPTRGIDVKSKSQIYEIMGRLAAGKKAVIFVSSYLPELLGVSDRLAVFHRGQLIAIRPAADWTETSLMKAGVTGKTDEDNGKEG